MAEETDQPPQLEREMEEGPGSPPASGGRGRARRRGPPAILDVTSMSFEEHQERIRLIEYEIYELGDQIRSLKNESLHLKRKLARRCPEHQFQTRTESCCALGECPVCTRHWPFFTGYTHSMQQLTWSECRICGWVQINRQRDAIGYPLLFFGSYPPAMGSPQFRPQRDPESDLDDSGEAGAPSPPPGAET